MRAATDNPPDPKKRDAILDAALALFAERGFHGTAVPLVAEKAGVGAGTLYRYFESKEALVNALYRHWKERLVQHLMADFPVAAPAREQFHYFWQRFGGFALLHSEGFTFLELQHHAPYLDGESLALERTTLDIIRGFVERAQQQKAMKPMAPELVMALVYGALVGLVKGSQKGYYALTKKTLATSEQAIWEAIRL